jgi:hypothetical protein
MARNLNSKSLGKHYVSQASESIEKALSLWDEGGSYLGNILLGFLQLFGFDMDLSCERIVLKVTSAGSDFDRARKVVHTLMLLFCDVNFIRFWNLNFLWFLKGTNGNPGGIFKREDRHCALWIDDPLHPGVNVGAGSFGMVHVQVLLYQICLKSGQNRPLCGR